MKRLALLQANAALGTESILKYVFLYLKIQLQGRSPAEIRRHFWKNALPGRVIPT